MNVLQDGSVTEGAGTQWYCSLPLVWEVEGLNPVEDESVQIHIKHILIIKKSMVCSFPEQTVGSY